jgi:hypothetical protein
MSNPPEEPLTKETRDFVVAEHKLLRDEISNLIKQLEQNQGLSLVASGAIWSWLVTLDWRTAYIPVLFLPGALSILFWLRWLALETGIFNVAAYERRLEERLSLQGMGWETHVEATGRGLFKLFHWTFWSVLITGNFALAIAYWCLH